MGWHLGLKRNWGGTRPRGDSRWHWDQDGVGLALGPGWHWGPECHEGWGGNGVALWLGWAAGGTGARASRDHHQQQGGTGVTAAPLRPRGRAGGGRGTGGWHLLCCMDLRARRTVAARRKPQPGW